MASRLRQGYPVFLYHSVYIKVNSILMDERLNEGFDMSALFEMGLAGWEAVGIIPRTIGVGLTNTSMGSAVGNTSGGGSGGNILGAHVLLRKRLSMDDMNESLNDEVANVIRAQLG